MRGTRGTRGTRGVTKIDDPKIWIFSLIKMLKISKTIKNIIRPNLTHNSITNFSIVNCSAKNSP